MPTPIRSRVIGMDVDVRAMEVLRKKHKRWEATRDEVSVGDGAKARELPPANLWRGDPCDKRSSRMMYQSLLPKHGGNNLSQEVEPQARFRSPHDATTIIVARNEYTRHAYS